MGVTGNLRTQRISATGGFRTWGSIIVGNSGSGGGSSRRIAGFYLNQSGGDVNGFYNSILGQAYGGNARSRGRFYLTNNFY